MNGAAEGVAYARRGVAVTWPHLAVQLRILVVFAAPAAVAAWLAWSTSGRRPAFWEQAGMDVLPWLTAILGTVVVMVAVSRQARDAPIGVVGATVRALPWVPRYGWTNVHTTLIFWVPVGILVEARALQEGLAPLEGILGTLVGVLWWVLTGAVGLFLHTRTMLAPFLAVHGDQPATLAALEAWRLSGRFFGRFLATLLAGALPVALPMAAAAGIAAVALAGPALAAFWAAAQDLVWVGIQIVRPLLIPALYMLYRDVWPAELQRRDVEGAPPVPLVARILLRITRPLPHLGRLSPL